jgi:DUF1009 family protein
MTTPTTRAELRLPITLAAGDRVGIVAGHGRLPVNVAQSLAAAGHSPFIVHIEGETESGSGLADFDHETLPLEDFGGLAPLLKRHRVTHVVLAGGIDRRPDWRAVRLRFSLLTLLPKAIAALAKGDDELLRALIRSLEARGFKVVGAHEIVPDLVVQEGVMTRVKPQKADWVDLEAGLVAARAIGALDIGQGAVAIGGRAIALEGIEGTDQLLARVAGMRGHGRLAGKMRGVLVKSAKPGQEMRADMPAIGPATVEGAHEAGLAGIGVEAGGTLVLDYSEMVERADELGLFIVGLASGSPE